MATETQIADFERSFELILKQSEGIDDEIAKDVRRLLRGLRSNISAIIASNELKLINVASMNAQIQVVIDQFTQAYKGILEAKQIEAFELGVAVVDEPLARAGAMVASQLNFEALEAQARRGSAFITNLAEEMKNRINTQVLLSVMGEQSFFQTMKNIGNLNIPRSTFKSVADRAEAIARTEVISALNQGTTKRLEQTADTVKGMKKYWITAMDSRVRPEHIRQENLTNPDKGGRPIPVKDKFALTGPRGVERASGPHDPNLSAGNSIQCRCRLGIVIDNANLETGRVL